MKLSKLEESIDYNKKHSKLLENIEVPFYLALELKLRRSSLGKFIDSFNYQQVQDLDFNKNKLQICYWDVNELKEIEKELLNENNNVFENFFELLDDAVLNNDCITWNFLYENIKTLRLENYHVTTLDCSVCHFKNLTFLFLGGNHLVNVPGGYLPRTLKFLELFANNINNIDSICNNPPKGLVHLGLDSNNLSSAALIGNCHQFNRLRSLNLSNNGIYDLVDLLDSLRHLPSLTSLQLEGNPCYTCIIYKNVVFNYLPKLIYLDNTQITSKDKKQRNFVKEDLNSAALVFTCHRIIGLQAPPKQPGVIQTIHFEVRFPLLEELTSESDESCCESSSQMETSKEQDVEPPLSVYEAEDEYEKEILLNIKNKAFKTQRLPWAKIIQFPEDELVISSPTNDLAAIRDSFKSRVNVKVVYLKVEAPKKGIETPQETILKKITLANFYCDLYNVNWSDETIDFYWAADVQPNTHAIPVKGSLRAINYVEGKKPPPKKGEELDVDKVPSKEYLPNIFTVQIGFGLLRQ